MVLFKFTDASTGRVKNNSRTPKHKPKTQTTQRFVHSAKVHAKHRRIQTQTLFFTSNAYGFNMRPICPSRIDSESTNMRPIRPSRIDSESNKDAPNTAIWRFEKVKNANYIWIHEISGKNTEKTENFLIYFVPKNIFRNFFKKLQKTKLNIGDLKKNLPIHRPTST